MKKIALILSFIFSTNLLSSDEIRVGMDFTYPPFGYIKNGSPVGFDVDFTALLFNSINKAYIIKEERYEQICQKILSGEIDIGISAFGIDEHSQNCNTSVSYFDTKILFLKKESSKIEQISDLSGKKVGILSGDMFENLAHQIPSVSVVKSESVVGLTILLEQGKVDAIIVDSSIASQILDGSFEFVSDTDKKSLEMAKSFGFNEKIVEFASQFSTEAKTVILFPKDRLKELAIQIDTTILKLKDDERFKSLLKKYRLD